MAAVSRAHFRMNLTGTGGRPPASTAKLRRSRAPEAESEAAVKTLKDFISLFAMLLFLATAAAGCSGETDDRAGEIVAGGEGRSVLGDMTGAGSLGALLADARVIDLSHAYDENTIYWPTSEGFALETVFKGRRTGTGTRRTTSAAPNTAARTSTRPFTLQPDTRPSTRSRSKS